MSPRDGGAPGAAPTTPHDASPEAALAAIRAFDGPLLVELDQTLYLGDATEDFIDSARPAVVAAALMMLLDWIRPWRWTGGEATRSAWRVRLVTLLMPWTPRRWRQRIAHLVEQFGNGPLIAALRAHASRPIVVTRGARTVTAPLVAAFNLGEAGIVATRPENFEDGLRDTLSLAVDALGQDTVRRALVVARSADDLSLFEACARPLRTVWPQARHRVALSDLYLPGRYVSEVRHAGERYVAHGILQEDFAFWLLGSIGLAALPVLHIAGLLFLLLSFWAIYECGYVDQDRLAAAGAASEPGAPAVPTPRWDPWVWAVVSGAIAILLLRWPDLPSSADGAVWLGVLLATHGGFLLYNRIDKSTRVWLYPGLQFARAAAFVTLVPVAAIGAAAVSAHILARWMPHYLRRYGGKNPAAAPLPVTRLLFFAVLALMLALTQGFGAVLSGTAAALLAWMLLRARLDLRAIAVRARRLDRPQAQP